ncbi:MAG: hypothetical protein II913_04840 [Elusimicrobiaceae bacterium]|nr:hypothetical protein [Elusimicrobiaceae bacterium]
MSRDILALDFYGKSIVAALASLDENTDTLRIRHVVHHKSDAFAGAFVRERATAQDELSRIFAQMSEYTERTPSVIVGVRGSFLSFRHSTGFTYTESRNRIIRESDIDNAIHESLPKDLDDSLEVIDILPLSYTIDDQPGATDPIGMHGYCLGVETFVSYGVRTHLINLKSVLTACGCEDFQWIPSSIALGEMALTSSEKSSSLLVDLGENGTSALLYHKNSLLEAWEIPFGLDRIAEGISDQLQNDYSTALEVLRNYEPDPIMDEVLEEAAMPILKALHKEFVQSLTYIQHPPSQLVLCGQGAFPILQKALKSLLGTRKARLCAFDKLIADCSVDFPKYDGVLALLQYAVMREQNQLGMSQIKEEGLLGKLFGKLGFNVF